MFYVVLQPVDISQAVTERIKAQRLLAENPYDVHAICMLSRAQEQVRYTLFFSCPSQTLKIISTCMMYDDSDKLFIRVFSNVYIY